MHMRDNDNGDYLGSKGMVCIVSIDAMASTERKKLCKRRRIRCKGRCFKPKQEMNPGRHWSEGRKWEYVILGKSSYSCPPGQLTAAGKAAAFWHHGCSHTFIITKPFNLTTNLSFLQPFSCLPWIVSSQISKKTFDECVFIFSVEIWLQSL